MKPVEMNLPEQLVQKAQDAAEDQQMTLDQFVTDAIADRLSALEQLEYLK